MARPRCGGDLLPPHRGLGKAVDQPFFFSAFTEPSFSRYLSGSFWRASPQDLLHTRYSRPRTATVVAFASTVILQTGSLVFVAGLTFSAAGAASTARVSRAVWSMGPPEVQPSL